MAHTAVAITIYRPLGLKLMSNNQTGKGALVKAVNPTGLANGRWVGTGLTFGIH